MIPEGARVWLYSLPGLRMLTVKGAGRVFVIDMPGRWEGPLVVRSTNGETRPRI